MKDLLKEVEKNIDEYCIKFAIWLQDNYSQTRYKNSAEKDMLPKGKMRKDFTDEIYTIDEILEHYKNR